MSEHPLVSVVIPAYERPQYLNEALESVQRQTLNDYEVIVVDDASSDHAVGQYRLPPLARLIRRNMRHGTGGAGRNQAVRLARGRYVAFLDQDDIWLPRKLETQVALLVANPKAALTWCHPTIVDDRLTVLRVQPPCRRLKRDLAQQMLLEDLAMPPSSVMLRRDVINEDNPFDEGLVSADFDLWLRIATRHSMVRDIRSYVLYRRHVHQVSGNRMGMCHNYLAVLDKASQWLGCCRPDLLPLLPRLRNRALRQMARIQTWHERDALQALKSMRQAFRTYPWSPKLYALWLLVAACAMHPAYRQRRKS